MMTMEGKSFASKFALYGGTGSLASLAILALLCHAGSFIETEEVVVTTRLPTRYHTEQRQQRRMELILGNNTSYHRRQEEEYDDSGGMPCEDIFRHVKREHYQIINSTEVTISNHLLDDENNGNNDGVDGDYARRLCHYAQRCKGAYPSRTFLPLILCHGLENIDITADNETTTTSQQSNQQQQHCMKHILQSIFLYIILPPILLIYLFLLFRLLATTADSYFSPALETISKKLKLPPRFAGATLLALGNGSPDLGATANAILLWNESDALDNAKYEVMRSSGSGISSRIMSGNSSVQEGWTMGIGSLTGGGMFVGTIVLGLLVQQSASGDGIPCRFAFLRDVTMYAASVGVVWCTFEKGTVARENVVMFLGMYLTYVVVIFCSDMYHRKVTLKNLRKEEKEQKTARRSARKSAKTNRNDYEAAIANESTPLMVVNGNPLQVEETCEKLKAGKNSNSNDKEKVATSSKRHAKAQRRLSMPDRFAMLMSNYDPSSMKFGTISRSGSEDTTSSSSGNANTSTDEDESEWERMTSIIHEAHPGIHSSYQMSIMLDEGRHSSARRPSVEPLSGVPKSLLPEIAIELKERRWSIALFLDAYNELAYHYNQYMKSYFDNDESLSVWDKLGILELPFVALRTVTIPVPCEGHYCRSILALSLALSPYWVMWYSNRIAVPAELYALASMIIALLVLRYADDKELPLFAMIPLSLYGFVLAATWIDTIADNLVALLQFLGTISRIPSTILGMTVLAWGNSMGDLSANLAMARKGMPDMATTGCFAGPSFNLLVGTGLGFLYLQYERERSSISPVTLTPILRIGFTFIIVNCMLIIICSGVFFQRRLPYRYSFILFAMYLLFIATSLESMFQ